MKLTCEFTAQGAQRDLSFEMLISLACPQVYHQEEGATCSAFGIRHANKANLEKL